MKLLFAFFALLFLLACEDTAPSDTALREENSENTPYALIQQDLQGIWKRIDYPHGTIEFKGSEVKVTEGEGGIEAPTFEAYVISNNCASNDPNRVQATKAAFYIRRLEENYCELMRLEGTQLTLSDVSGTYEIIYKKQ
jgi:hypothetical protein